MQTPAAFSRAFVYNFQDMRKFLFILVLFLAAAFVFVGLGELESIVDTLQHGNLWLILLALSIQGAWFLMVGTTYQSLYHLFELDRTILRLSLVVAAANFINIVAPSGGMGGVALFVRDGTRSGQPVGRVIVANVLFFFVDYVAFLVVLTLGLVVLFRRNDLGPSEIGASAFMFLMAAVFGSLIYLGYRNAHRLGDLLATMARFVNRLARPFIHREYLSEVRAHEFAEEIGDGLRSLPHRPLDLALPLLFAFTGKNSSDRCTPVRVPGFPGPLFGRNDHRRLRDCVSLHDRITHTGRDRHCRGDYATGARLAPRSLEPGGGRHTGLPRHHVLDSIWGGRDCLSRVGPRRGLNHVVDQSARVLET